MLVYDHTTSLFDLGIFAGWWFYLYASEKLIYILLLIYLSVTFLIKSVTVP